MVDRMIQLKTIQQEAFELFVQKNKDYGDAFAKYGIVGVMMRIQDKLSRTMSITDNNITMVKNESLRDTLLDLHNYAAMGIMLLKDT
jgi:Nucleotide modification associated domain 1